MSGPHRTLQVFLALLVLAFFTLRSEAGTITVDGTTCTLADAVASANSDSSVGGCDAGSGADTIVFSAALTGSTISLSATANSTYGPSALLINSTVTIDGENAPGLVIGQSGTRRLFYVTSSGSLTLRDLTLSGGVSQGFDGGARSRGGAGGGGAGLGGAIFNEGSVTIIRSTLTGNQALGGDGGFNPDFGEPDGSDGGGGAGVAGDGGDGGDSPGSGGTGGGGIGGDGGSDCTDGTNGGFGSGGGGGGADTEPAPNVTDPGCNGGDGGVGGGGGGGGSGEGGAGLAGAGGFGGGNGANGGNEVIIPGGRGGGGAGMGGAIFNNDGTVTIRNSTLSGNTAAGGSGANSGDGLGGGIFNYNGSLTVQNATINGNSADDGGGGIYNLGDGASATVVLDNAIVSNSTSGAALGKDFNGTTINGGAGITSGTGNLIESAVNFAGTIVSTSDPALGALADNGGPTLTHALLGGSPAIDAGDNAKVPGGQTADQRGYTPRIDGTVDIGAVESGAMPPNQPPVADAGPDQTVECASPSGTSVDLDGTGSSDPDDDPLTYTWTGPFTEGGGTTTGANPTVTLPFGVHTITLEVDDGNGATDTDEVEITVEDTIAPVITLNGDNPLTLECSVDTYAELGANALDACVGPVAVSISGTVDVTIPGDYTVTYSADDGHGNSDSVDRTVIVEDTIHPELSLNGDNPLTLECVLEPYVEPGAVVTDICDPNPTLTITGTVDHTTPGSYPITYVAEDASGNDTTAVRTVNVVDTIPPDITVTDGPMTLWPPNHKYDSFSLDDLIVAASDICDLTVSAEDVKIASASSDEEENAVGEGDGNTEDDIVIAGDCRSVDLRAERYGTANGRWYTLNFEVADASDNVGEASFGVEVPHEKPGVAVDDGPLYTEDGCEVLSSPKAVAKEAVNENETVQNAHTAILTAEVGAVESEAEETPDAFALEQNYPNPFNPSTTIRFAVPEASHVSLVVFDVMGRQVIHLIDGVVGSGMHSVTFNARGLPSGSYLYRLTTPEGSFVDTMLLLE